MSRKTSVFIRLVIGISVLGVILYHTNTNENLFELFINSNKLFLVAGFAIFFVHYYLIFLRWRFILLTVGSYSFSSGYILRSLLGGNSLGLLTPGRLGELARGVFFQRQQFWQISSLSVIDKGYANIVSIFLGVLGLWFLGLEKLGLSEINKTILYLFIFILLLIGVVLIARPRLFSLLIRKIMHYLPVKRRRYFEPLCDNFERLSRRESLTIALISVLINITSFVEFYVFLLAFTQIGFFNAFIAFESAYITVNFLPFSFSDIGIREGVRIFYFGIVGAGAAAVLNTSLIMFFVNSLLPSALGLIAIPQIKRFLSDQSWKS